MRGREKAREREEERARERESQGKREGERVLTVDLWPLISLLTYQSLHCDLLRRLTAIVFAPLATANFVPGRQRYGTAAAAAAAGNDDRRARHRDVTDGNGSFQAPARDSKFKFQRHRNRV